MLNRSALEKHGRHPSRFQTSDGGSDRASADLRRKVESRISSHGMTAADVQTFVDEIKRHPDVSTALLQKLRSEVNRLMQGQRFSFDFD